MSREAMKLALEAFGEIAWSNETQWQRDRAKKAITALKQALEQPEPEPVACHTCKGLGRIYMGCGSWIHCDTCNTTGKATIPPKHEPPCKTGSQCTTKCTECAEPEPVAWTDENFTELAIDEDIAKEIGATVPLYTSPPKHEPEPVIDKSAAIRIATSLGWTPKREWVGLTDEEIDEGQRQSWVEKQAFESAVWWAEAKLKEKNHD